MKNIIAYKVITGARMLDLDTSDGLESMVNSDINEGWQPFGSVSVVVFENKRPEWHKSISVMHRSQVMVKFEGGPAAVVVTNKTSFDVILVNGGPNKLQVVKVVKEIIGVGLKEAKDLVEGAQKLVKGGVSFAEAEYLASILKEAGAEVLIK